MPATALVISDVHLQVVTRGSVIKARAAGGEPRIAATYRHGLGDYLRAALNLGLQVRRCEEPAAADLRQRILNETDRTLAAYADLGLACQWAGELAGRVDALTAAINEESRARSMLDAARRDVGGPAQDQVDALAAQLRALDGELARSLARVDRLGRRFASAGERRGMPLLGVLFGLLMKRRGRRLTRAEEEGQGLRTAQGDTRADLVGAERELDAVTRGHPAVRAAGAALSQAAQHRDGRQAEALAAARTCGDAVAAMEPPYPLYDASQDASEPDVFGFQSWLTQRLPVLQARGKLLADWHAEVSGAIDQLYPELIRYADVVAATCIGAASRSELSDVDFDLAIVDEAGQIGTANALVPLTRARRGVLVGDHQQLPPFLDSAVAAWGADAGDPVVEDLLAKSALELLADKLNPENVVMLTRQRRMPAVIADFISAAFYDGCLRTDVRREHRDPLFGSPMAFVDTARLPAVRRYEKPGRDREQWGQPGYTNPAEAALLTELAVFYHRLGTEWAVIVPYRAQAAKITTAVAPQIADAELASLNVGTVDSFQGGERDVILYGFTRSNPGGRVGFLDELRRANVAFTRAKRQLVLVGDMGTLTMARDQRFRELAQSLRAYLAEHGDIRQYQDIYQRLTGASGLAGDQ